MYAASRRGKEYAEVVELWQRNVKTEKLTLSSSSLVRMRSDYRFFIVRLDDLRSGLMSIPLRQSEYCRSCF